MKKLGLCVRYDCNNFGSMLQIFATQKTIEQCGVSYEIIRYDKVTLKFLFKNITRLFNPHFMAGKLQSLRKKLQLCRYPGLKEGNARRMQLFSEFRRKYIGPYSAAYRGYEALCAGAKQYNAVAVGSDQLWSPAGLKTKFYNLLFVPDTVRKISLATSFGVSQIPKSQQRETAAFLSRIEYLSVRELSGVDIVRQTTGRNALVALDPTMLFSGEQWDTFFPPHPTEHDGYIFAYLLGTNPAHRQAIERLARDTGLPIVTCPHMDAFAKCDLTFGQERLFDVSPEDFLQLIRRASFVCTDSFHGCVFSILFHKRFLAFDRYKDTIRASNNGRIRSLFEQLGLEDRHVSADDPLYEYITKAIDYEAVEKRLALLRKESIAFIREALTAQKREIGESGLPPALCTGCGACAAACPQQCIKMVADDKGFLFPKIDRAVCVQCNHCEDTCPVRHPALENATRTGLVVRHRNHDVVRGSTSGGAFTALAEVIMARGGTVYGAGIEGGVVRHIRADTNKPEALAQMRGSKYVQSDLGSTFFRIKEDLLQGRWVLFSGTPCQVDGLLRFLGHGYGKLVTIDVACHGVSSPKVFASYVASHEKQHGSEIESVRFRNKTYGYHSGTMQVRFEYGKIYYGSARVDPFLRSYFSGLCSRESCYECPSKRTGSQADITIFDCWHPEELVPGLRDDDEGFTNLVIRTQQGEDIVRNADLHRYPAAYHRQRELDGVMLDGDPQRHSEREQFFMLLNKDGLSEAVQALIPVTPWDRMLESAKTVIFKFGLMPYFKKLKR